MNSKQLVPHERQNKQDGLADFNGRELALHVPHMVQRHKTFIAFILVQLSFDFGFAKDGRKLLGACSVKLDSFDCSRRWYFHKFRFPEYRF